MKRKPRRMKQSANPLSVACPVPHCCAPPGVHCRDARGFACSAAHPGRFRVVRGGHKRRIA